MPPDYFDSILVEMQTIDAVETSIKTTLFGVELATSYDCRAFTSL
jgi:hypothetical protein